MPEPRWHAEVPRLVITGEPLEWAPLGPILVAPGDPPEWIPPPIPRPETVW